jgi:hypothetical protein
MIEIDYKNHLYIPNYSRTFYLELQPTGEINEDSMIINGLNVNYLKEYGVNRTIAIREIKKYMRLNLNDTAVFIAYCGVLDKIFFDQLFQDEGLESPFHYEIIELSSLAIGKLDLAWGFTEKELLTKLQIDDLTQEQKHNALQDTILQAKEFCGIMNYRRE